jgi:TonB family protein
MNAVQKQAELRSSENCMFKELSFSYKRLVASIAGSYSLHLIFVAFLFYFYTQTLQFVVPHLVETGHNAQGVTHLYWLQDNRGNESLSPTRKPVISSRFAPKGKDNVFRFGRNLRRKNSNKSGLASAAGSPGNTSLPGDDIRPALPIATLDPVIIPADLAGGVEGDVIVEVSIDDKGNIIAKKMEHGLGPAIDRKVLAAIGGWRFSPAMKDGRPIPQKQDIHYHFPVGGAGPTNPQGTHPTAALAQSPCPVLLVSGTGDRNHISITFMNMGKLPIRQLEFNCGPRNSGRNTADLPPCRENNALFYPGQAYTVDYATHGRSPNIRISVSSVTVSDGYVWKPSRSQSCGTVTIDVDQHVH